MISKGIRIGVAMVAVSVANVLPPSTFRVDLKSLAGGALMIDVLLTAREGYRRRRLYWTADSWRRYLMACAVPVGALVILAGMLAALEFRHPWVWAARSTTRGIWAAIMLLLVVIGGGGLAIVGIWSGESDVNSAKNYRWDEDGEQHELRLIRVPGTGGEPYLFGRGPTRKATGIAGFLPRRRRGTPTARRVPRQLGSSLQGVLAVWH